MTKSSRWADLRPRILSAVVMLGIGLFAIWAGGVVFNLTIAVVCGGILWELSGMMWPGQSARALKLGVAGGAALLVASLVPTVLVLPILLLPVALGALSAGAQAQKFSIFALWAMCAAFGFVWLRNAQGVALLLWLISVVVATDVLGYFAGKVFGGPKFWPRISPKKTWSGTAAGWLAAAFVGALFASPLGFGAGLIGLSVVLAMASQAGDIAESALKRQMGVKDSSDMIPGHGGLFDRFDGMLGAAALFLVIVTLWGI